MENIPCQDYSLSMSQGDVTIAIVCDGHGGKPYFRSNTGARLAAGITSYCLLEFAKEQSKTLLKVVEKKNFCTTAEISKNERETEIYKTFQGLFASILYLWDLKIKEDISKNSFSEQELQPLPIDYVELLRKDVITDIPYGTTLIAYMQTKEYWLSFQIGDGIAFFHNGEEWSVPIPTDASCHDNITTSLCDNNALCEFRVCYETSGRFPEAIFLFSDGMEKAFLSTNKLADYNQRMLEVLRNCGKRELVKTMNEMLPIFSKLTSGDDISIACVYNKPKTFKN